MKRTVIFAATALSLTLLSGCGGKNVTTSNPKEHFTYTVNVLNAEKHGQDAAYKYLADKFNVSFEFIPISFSDWAEKTRIWIAGGDMPDIMWASVESGTYKEFLSWVDQGFVRDIPLDKKKHPNLNKIISGLETRKFFEKDGKLYAWPSANDSKVTNNIAMQGYFYRRDWAEKLGLAKPNDEYSWDEFVALAKAFVEKDPGGNGAGKTIGLGSVGWAFPQAMGIMQTSPYWDTYKLQNGKYEWGMGLPETLQGIKEAKRLYDEGIIWRDHVVTTNDDAKNKFMSSELGIYYDNWGIGGVDNVRKAIKKMNPNVDVEKMVVPMFVKSPDGKIQAQKAMEYWTVSVFNKNMSDAKMNRILEIYDWIASEEGFEYSTKGVKGVDWNEENGKVKMQPKDMNKENYLMKVMVRGTSSFDFVDPRNSVSGVEAIKKMADRYKKDDVFVRTLDYNMLYYSAPNKDKYGVMYDEGKEKIKRIIISSNDPEKDWKAWLDSVNDKVKVVEKEINDGLTK